MFKNRYLYFIYIAFVSLIILLMLTSCRILEPYTLDIYEYFGLQPDNFMEEVVEEVGSKVIKNYTGADLEFDITPSSEED